MLKKADRNIVRIFCESQQFVDVGAKVVSAIREALFFEKKNHCVVYVHLVTNVSMRRINFSTRKKNQSTNVLSFTSLKSFPYPDIPKGYTYSGDIFLAPYTIRSRGENIVFLAIHGLLHLLGYDHKKKSDRIEMEAREKDICASLPVFLQK